MCPVRTVTYLSGRSLESEAFELPGISLKEMPLCQLLGSNLNASFKSALPSKRLTWNNPDLPRLVGAVEAVNRTAYELLFCCVIGVLQHRNVLRSMKNLCLSTTLQKQILER